MKAESKRWFVDLGVKMHFEYFTEVPESQRDKWVVGTRKIENQIVWNFSHRLPDEQIKSLAIDSPWLSSSFANDSFISNFEVNRTWTILYFRLKSFVKESCCIKFFAIYSYNQSHWWQINIFFFLLFFWGGGQLICNRFVGENSFISIGKSFSKDNSFLVARRVSHNMFFFIRTKKNPFYAT